MLQSYIIYRYLHSFPTRRSSDLGRRRDDVARGRRARRDKTARGGSCAFRAGIVASADGRARSEEHTSELQSQSNIVCRLLLEKKNLRRQARGIQITR